MIKRGKYQASQANKIKERYKNRIEVNIGMVVNLKVDRKDRASTKIRGLVGFIICASESATSYNYGICTRYGILSSRRKMIMYDTLSFTLLKKATLSERLKEIKEQTKGNKLNIDTLPLILVRLAHKKEYGS